ncbi:MAG: gliding motility-associated C-terminal domain-containing protein [Bacteroidia bacterium]
MKKLFFFLCFLFICISHSFASHLRAGDISYTYIPNPGGLYKYHIIVTTYAKWDSPLSTDDCTVMVRFGDGDSSVAPRTNGPLSSICSSGIHAGVLLTGVNTRVNKYEVDHIYGGPGVFTISINDYARNPEIQNIPSPDEQSFFLFSQLSISPFFPPNSSPVLLNAPLDNACTGSCFEHNPGAYDPDGDSLYFSLSPCYGAGGIPIPGWTYPVNMNASSIDSHTGIFAWCSPVMLGIFNVAILIKQYHYSPADNTWYFVGSVFRDMQITVQACSNTPPEIQHVNDTCVVAGTNLNFNVTATDPELSIDSLFAVGGPFVTMPSATFTTSSGGGTVTGIFNWTPGCNQVKYSPYLVTFKAKDSGSPSMVNFESMFIKVIAPPISGLTATPGGASIMLSWNYPLCDTLGTNALVHYLIYRKNSCDPWQPGPCETGVPSYTGYSLIGTNAYNDVNFTDNNGGSGLTMGINYSYIIVAVYADGSQSIASQNVCAKLVRDVPIITNVSVVTTDPSTGKIAVRWLKPVGSVADLDTIINPPPYECRIMLASGTGYTALASYNYSAYWMMTDSVYVHTVNSTVQQKYKVEFYSNGNFVGASSTASSVFLASAPGDRKVNLTWTEAVPWTNYNYFIYRESFAGSGIFNLIDSTTAPNYIDTALANEVEYCYRILSKGEYSDPALPRPLWNYSEIRCDVPIDLIPPCQPKFDVITDCNILQNTITWTNPNTYCCDDAVQINIYFSPTTDDPLQLIYSTTTMSDSSYTLPVYLYEHTVPSVAGCYAVTAVDSALHPNESPIINKICIDNCPEYELPNVFTPNADGKNDLFTPLPGYRYVKDVEIHIYDRWGLEMFQTTDKDVKWDGTNASSGTKCTDGVYFYVCTVNEIRISGIRPRVIKGFVQIIRENRNPDY